MNPINTNDFSYLWRGQQREILLSEHADRLASVKIQGKGLKRALLLLHGFGSSPAVYRLMLPALTGYDALVCPVLPGHGTNLDAFAQVNACDWITAVESACEALLQHYETVDVMGLSLGGLLACHLAKKFPIHHLYLLAPALALRTHVKISLICAHALQRLGLKQIRNRAGNLRSTAHAELTYRQLPVSTIIEILTLIDTFTFTPPACPIELFLGRYDNVVDVAKVASCVGALSNTTTHWLTNSAHVLPLDNDVDAIIRCVNSP